MDQVNDHVYRLLQKTTLTLEIRATRGWINRKVDLKANYDNEWKTYTKN